MATKESELSQDVVFDILSSPRRRYVLYYLRSTGETVQLTDLAEKVAAWENDVEPGDITDQERKRVYVSLYQTHIPRLAEASLIDYEKESGQIAPSDQTARIDRYLNSNDDDEWPWQEIYLSLAAVSAVILALTAFVDAIPELLAAAIVIAAVATVVIAHLLYRQSKRGSIPEELWERS